MTNSLQIVDKREVCGKFFKMYGTVENPLFLAKDVANWIEYDINQVGKMLKTVDEDEKIKILCDRNNITGTSRARKTQEAWFLTEDGLYEVLFQSRKPIAKQFKKQVKAILKELRLKGKVELQEKMEHIEQYNQYLLGHVEEVEKMYVETKNENKELQELYTEEYCARKELETALRHRFITSSQVRYLSSIISIVVDNHIQGDDSRRLKKDKYRKEIQRYLFREFGVTTYGNIASYQYDRAIAKVHNYKFSDSDK